MEIPYNKTPVQNVKFLYRGMINRIKNIKSYKNRNIVFSLDEFKDFIKKDKNYKSIYKIWVRNNFHQSFSPSIDRIDNDKSYTLDNIQIITKIDNIRKSHQKNYDKNYLKTLTKNIELTPIFILKRRADLMKQLKGEGYSGQEIGLIFNINRSNVKRTLDKFKTNEK